MFIFLPNILYNIIIITTIQIAEHGVELTTSYIQRGTSDLNASFSSIGVDLAGILGDAWRAPKVRQC